MKGFHLDPGRDRDFLETGRGASHPQSGAAIKVRSLALSQCPLLALVSTDAAVVREFGLEPKLLSEPDFESGKAFV